MAKPAFVGPHAHLNLITLFLKWMFFEGKMRGLFEILFGAGVVLLTGRAEKRGAGAGIADIYMRRNMWLTFIGWVHGTFLWGGDIIFKYGLCGLAFLYPFRKLTPKTLLLVGAFLSLLAGTYGYMKVWGGIDDLLWNREAAVITSRIQTGEQPTSNQRQLLERWQQRVEKEKIARAEADKGTPDVQGGYLTNLLKDGIYYGRAKVGSPWSFQFFGPLGMMLIGMALFKNGFLTAELSYGVYLLTAVLGFSISIPLYVLGMWKSYTSGLYFLTVDKWIFAPYALTQTAGALAICAALLLVIKSGAFRALLRLIASVGQTALSNYLFTTVLCQILFLWGPWKLYNKLEYYQLNYVLLGVWTINLLASSLWLRVFEFGPLEWIWRSLTYWKLQPLRIRQ